MKSHCKIWSGICQIWHSQGKLLPQKEDRQDKYFHISLSSHINVLKPVPNCTIYYSLNAEISESLLKYKEIRI